MKQHERAWQPVALGGDAPAPAGAYSPVARAGGFVFVSGQVPRDPATGKVVGDDIAAQTAQVVANVQRALAAAGASLEDVVSVTVYLADIDDWAAFNTAYQRVMPSPFPTRTAVGANLRGILVEMSAIACTAAPAIAR